MQMCGDRWDGRKSCPAGFELCDEGREVVCQVVESIGLHAAHDPVQIGVSHEQMQGQLAPFVGLGQGPIIVHGGAYSEASD